MPDPEHFSGVTIQTPSTGLRHPSFKEGAGKGCSECGNHLATPPSFQRQRCRNWLFRSMSKKAAAAMKKDRTINWPSDLLQCHVGLWLNNSELQASCMLYINNRLNNSTCINSLFRERRNGKYIFAHWKAKAQAMTKIEQYVFLTAFRLLQNGSTCYSNTATKSYICSQ